MDTSFEESKENLIISAKILGFQDCIIELLQLKEKNVDINTITLSDLVENYKEKVGYTNK